MTIVSEGYNLYIQIFIVSFLDNNKKTGFFLVLTFVCFEVYLVPFNRVSLAWG